MAEAAIPPGRGHLSLVVFSGAFDRVHYALAIAAAALASGRPVTLFFAMGATRALERPDAEGRPGWARLTSAAGEPSPTESDAAFRAKGLAGFEDLLSACVALGAKAMVCEMGLRALDLAPDALRADVPIQPGGLVTFLAEAETGAMLFV
jgi:peroxiredoxin family protein